MLLLVICISDCVVLLCNNAMSNRKNTSQTTRCKHNTIQGLQRLDTLAGRRLLQIGDVCKGCLLVQGNGLLAAVSPLPGVPLHPSPWAHLWV